MPPAKETNEMQNRAFKPMLVAVAVAGMTFPHTAFAADTARSRGVIHCDNTSGLCFRVQPNGASCASHTWLARTRDEACPAASVGADGRWALQDTSGVSGRTRSCQYQWSSDVGASPDAAVLSALESQAAIETLEPDCEVVAVSGEAIDVTWPNLQDAFFVQAERLAALPSGEAAPAPVRVEVIDAAVTRRDPDGEPSFGRSGHGRAMGLIISKLACPAPGASCRAEVASTLALPLIATPDGVERDTLNGGYYGSLGDLSSAIDEAVTDWRLNALEHRLVINLSLGWEESHGGAYSDDPSSLPAPVLSVWEAIARARCHGAVVVAAAGNRVEGPDSETGPTYPAAWAMNTVPSEAQCASLGAPSVSSYDEDAPLVYAVGGLESNDKDLSIGRADARPEFVAPAAHAVVADGAGDHSVLQTGTSVAAAVTSAIAAVVWSYRPDLSAEQVMEMVYEGGADIGRPATFCLDGSDCGAARRVSMCGAVQEACETGLGSCPASVPACARLPGGRVARPEPVALPAAPVVSAQAIVPQTHVGWPCNGLLYADPDFVTENPCPASQFQGPSAVAAVAPQPSAPPICPHCLLDESELYIEINVLAEGVLTDPVLTVVVDSSDVRYYDLSSKIGQMSAGDTALVTNLNIGTSTFESATIEFMVDNSHSELSPVLPW